MEGSCHPDSPMFVLILGKYRRLGSNAAKTPSVRTVVCSHSFTRVSSAFILHGTSMRSTVLLLLGAAMCCCLLAPPVHRPVQAAHLRRSYNYHQENNQEKLGKHHRSLQQTAQQQGGTAGDTAADTAAADTAALCQRWGLKPAAAGAKVPRVYDFFLADQ